MSSGFITETELAEIRKKRQEEWEKVRKADDPIGKMEKVGKNKHILIFFARTTHGAFRWT